MLTVYLAGARGTARMLAITFCVSRSRLGLQRPREERLYKPGGVCVQGQPNLVQ